MQILVVVASIQMRTLKTEVEKGSMSTAIGHGLVGPKAQGNSVTKGSCALRAVSLLLWPKGNRVNIP